MYQKGSRVAYARFNASGSDKMNWMNISRLVTSSWSDVQAQGGNSLDFASLEGLDRYLRAIFIFYFF